jgi:hypothetical protein
MAFFETGCCEQSLASYMDFEKFCVPVSEAAMDYAKNEVAVGARKSQ